MLSCYFATSFQLLFLQFWSCLSSTRLRPHIIDQNLEAQSERLQTAEDIAAIGIP
ncbi:hypothetical protein KC19_2G088300 [Ceratodon purpureus]|uniref:Uncharacterized protein n=1 Tax=Ceratodon purpureus TaxID=3225 RepID=A0A8T0IRP9_CERPU|nr:hypothetical protein KC19_2G088300 [Ceratodon purpureus]